MDITFLGAAGTVTGSKHLVTAGRTRILVDCGIFQGTKSLRLRNWDAPPVEPSSLDAVVLTHAHLDHTGYLPLLVRRGFRGTAWCTPATAALVRVLLEDAAFLQEEDARRANRHGYSKHHPALPLYTVDDVERALRRLRTVEFDHEVEIGAVRATFVPAGHLLGAAGVRLESGGSSIFFSGDVGRPDDLLLRPPRDYAGSDTLVVEATYGDRRHGGGDPAAELADVVTRVCGRGGVLMIPAFAVGRTQVLLHLLARLIADGRVPRVPVFLNSPMGIEATEIFRDHPHDHRLSTADCRALAAVATWVRTVDESKALNGRGGPMIVIAGSGMATGGRILHHLESYGPDPDNGVLLVGYQSAGTRGAALRDGAESLKIHGKYVPIRAERFTVDGLSGHADWQELIGWMRHAPRPKRIFIVHAEPAAASAFREHLREELGWDATIAEDGQTVAC